MPKKKQQEEEAEPYVSPWARTWSCPACGRGTTLTEGVEAPDGAMSCQGCGTTSEHWLPPGVGHGEPELPVTPSR